MATLTYDLAVIGRANVERELASLERRYAQHARTMNRTSASVGGGTGSRSTPGGQASADNAAKRAIREQQRAIDQRLRSQAALHNQRTREEKQYATEQARTVASQQRAIDRQVRSQTSLNRQRIREERAVSRERDRVVNARSEFIRSTVGGGASRVVRGITAVGQAGAAMLGLGGAGLAVASVNSGLKLDESARRLSIASRAPGQAGVDPEVLRKEFTQTGLATGFDPERIAAATAGYVARTGDLATARANARTLATVAQGAGGDPTEVFAAAADLSTKLDIKSVEEMSQAFAILSQQGKKGAFELKAMAAEFPEVLAGAASAGVKGVSGVRDVGAIMQIARQASGSDAEASTAVQTFFRQLSHEAKDLQSGKALGGKKVQVFEGNDARNPMRNFADIAKDVLIQSGGDLTAFQKVFDIRGTKAGAPLLNAFRGARAGELERQKKSGEKTDEKKAVAAGATAVSDLFSSFRDVSANFGEVQRDANDAMKSPSVQLQMGMVQLKTVMADQLIPEVIKLIPRFAELAPLVGSLTQSLVRAVGFFAENPFSGLGLLVSGAIVAELAKAGISSAVSSALTSAIMARGGGIGVGAGIGSLKGGAATAAAAVGVGLAIDQATSFAAENGGWDGVKGFFGVGTNSWGADGVDEIMNARAKAEAEQRKQQEAATAAQSRPVPPSAVPVQLTADEANKQLQLMTQNLANANAELAKVRGDGINRGDRPGDAPLKAK